MMMPQPLQIPSASHNTRSKSPDPLGKSTINLDEVLATKQETAFLKKVRRSNETGQPSERPILASMTLVPFRVAFHAFVVYGL